MDAVLYWFRRDLRIDDNAGLSAALSSGRPVYTVFVFDRDILDGLPKNDRRVHFIWASLKELSAELESKGGSLQVLEGRASDEIPRLAQTLGVSAVYTHRDYEPQAMARDQAVEQALGAMGIAFEAVKDTVIFERDEILTQAGRPFTVFTPYKRAWLKKLPDVDLTPRATAGRWLPGAAPLPPLEDLGFEASDLFDWGFQAGRQGGLTALNDFLPRMAHYQALRDFPGKKGVSYLSLHLRFGTLSVRELVQHALLQRNEGAETWLSELIWREFYFQILYHFPYVVRSCFKPQYDAISWDTAPERLAAWQEGRTGYPIVDAGMRQLLTTGFMHNRLRMITASFLVKDLLLDWRLGEAWFALKLNDFDLAANNGGWQWAASTGCDAQPYFRIFNPVSQSERFDPSGDFIRKYIPELARVPTPYIHAPWQMPPVEQLALGISIPGHYPRPIVDHAVMREEALKRFKAVSKP